MAQTPNNIAEEPYSEQGKAPRFPRLKRISTVLVLIGILLVALYFIYSFFLSDMLQPNNGDQQTNAENKDLAGIVTNQLPTFSNGMQFQVNLADRRRYLSLNMRLALLDEDTLNYLNQRLPIVRDIILSTLQSQTSVSLSTSNGVQRLKENLLRRLNSGRVFTEEFTQLKGTVVLVKDVYFEEFILQ